MLVATTHFIYRDYVVRRIILMKTGSSLIKRLINGEKIDRCQKFAPRISPKGWDAAEHSIKIKLKLKLISCQLLELVWYISRRIKLPLSLRLEIETKRHVKHRRARFLLFFRHAAVSVDANLNCQFDVVFLCNLFSVFYYVWPHVCAHSKHQCVHRVHVDVGRAFYFSSLAYVVSKTSRTEYNYILIKFLIIFVVIYFGALSCATYIPPFASHNASM